MADPFFHRDSVSSNSVYRDIGQHAGRPFIIKAMLKETSLGDLACQLACLATIKNQFDHAELHVRYRDIRPYSRDMMRLVPCIDSATGIRGSLPKWLRFGLPDTRLWHPMARAADGRAGSRASFCDLCVSDWMVNPRWLHAMPNPVALQVPDDLAPVLETELAESGVNPEHWFAAIHYRASTYLDKRSGALRNGDPAAYQKLVDHVIDELGGQVVQLGHPELDPFPKRDGFVDLSRRNNSFLLQAFATSRARFMIGGPSGPAALAWCFQVPTGLVDASDGIGGWGNAEQVILTHEVTTPDGRVLRNMDLFRAGLADYPVLRDKIRAGESYIVRKNSASELAAVADHLHNATQDNTGWRATLRPHSGPKPNHFVWPPRTQENLRFIDV